jgi:phosphate:Na+ symporter
MPLRRAPRNPAGWLVGLALLLVAGPAAALQLEAPARSPHSSLRWAAVGDTLTVRVRALDEGRKPLAGIQVRLRAPLAPTAFVPGEQVVATGPDGVARFRLAVAGPPADVQLAARAVEEPETLVRVPVRILPPHWIARLIVGVAGGLAIFLFGMRLLGRSFEKVAGPRLRESLAQVTNNPIRAMLFGLVSTVLVQSSSASTVLLVSFVSTGLLTLRAGLGAVLGAAIGSTLTVQLIAFRVADWALLLVAAGFLFTMSGTRRVRRIGNAILGLGLVFFGLRVMSESLAPLDGLGPVVGFFVAAAENPVPALISAAVFTAVAQASAATLGIVLGLSLQGILPLSAALPFVLGANIGTATTAILASLGAPADGRRIAWAHAALRTAGALLALPLLGPFAQLVESLSADPARQVAHAFTILNVVTALIFLPFLPLAERAIRLLIPERRDEADDEYAPRSLDPRFHEQPEIAIAGALQEVLRMGQLVKTMLDGVKEALRRDDPDLAESVREQDDRVDRLDEAITRYLADLNTEDLSSQQSARAMDLLFVTKDLELIADIISKGLVPGLLRKKHREGLRFSEQGFRELLDFHDAVRELVELAVAAVTTWSPDLATELLNRKTALTKRERALHVAHLERLRAGNEASRATTTVHVDAVNDLKRIVSHSARIAHVVLGNAREIPRDTEMMLGDRED